MRTSLATVPAAGRASAVSDRTAASALRVEVVDQAVKIGDMDVENGGFLRKAPPIRKSDGLAAVKVESLPDHRSGLYRPYHVGLNEHSLRE
jgi:hypothetical protein